MKTYNQLTVSEKELVNSILSEAISLIKEKAEGTQFIRINMYEDAILELKEKGETELEICGAHTFSGSNWDDIDKSNQIEIFSFEQDTFDWVEGGGDWEDTGFGEDFLRNTDEEITQNIINYLYNY